jgi:hypothetical protein
MGSEDGDTPWAGSGVGFAFFAGCPHRCQQRFLRDLRRICFCVGNRFEREDVADIRDTPRRGAGRPRQLGAGRVLASQVTPVVAGAAVVAAAREAPQPAAKASIPIPHTRFMRSSSVERAAARSAMGAETGPE